MSGPLRLFCYCKIPPVEMKEIPTSGQTVFRCSLCNATVAIEVSALNDKKPPSKKKIVLRYPPSMKIGDVARSIIEQFPEVILIMEHALESSKVLTHWTKGLKGFGDFESNERYPTLEVWTESIKNSPQFISLKSVAGYFERCYDLVQESYEVEGRNYSQLPPSLVVLIAGFRELQRRNGIEPNMNQYKMKGLIRLFGAEGALPY
ncbi:MAG: hypothetical protein ACFFC7_12645 [Candidatus Hermodarchaeota archaeon]